MTEKYTPWYDPKVDGQPVRVGFYERKNPLFSWNGIRKDYWNGKEWLLKNSEYTSAYQLSVPWRGLISPSEGYHV